MNPLAAPAPPPAPPAATVPAAPPTPPAAGAPLEEQPTPASETPSESSPPRIQAHFDMRVSLRTARTRGSDPLTKIACGCARDVGHRRGHVRPGPTEARFRKLSACAATQSRKSAPASDASGERTHRHRGDVTLVDRRRLDRAVRPSDHVARAKLRRPPGDRVRRAAPDFSTSALPLKAPEPAVPRRAGRRSGYMSKALGGRRARLARRSAWPPRPTRDH